MLEGLWGSVWASVATEDRAGGRAEEPPGPGAGGSRGKLLLVAHNGHRFDVQVLYRECRRHGVSLGGSICSWHYCDSLDIVDLLLSATPPPFGPDGTLAPGDVGSLLPGPRLECRKLQCLARDLGIARPGGGSRKAGAQG